MVVVCKRGKWGKGGRGGVRYVDEQRRKDTLQAVEARGR